MKTKTEWFVHATFVRMIRHLLLLRHAETAEKLTVQNDFDRPLTERGIQQAVHVGTHLKQNRWKPQLIIASPSLRTLSTAKIVADSIHYPQSEIIQEATVYHGSVLQLYQALQQIHPDFTEVLVVAHNPGISYLGEWLTKVSTALQPAGLLRIEFQLPQWPELREGSGKWHSTFQP